MKKTHMAVLLALGALAAAPLAEATHQPNHDPDSKSKKCKRPTTKKAFVVKGTLAHAAILSVEPEAVLLKHSDEISKLPCFHRSNNTLEQ